ncbi:MAG: DUF6751 family protein [Lachnospiraceae bacterium]
MITNADATIFHRIRNNDGDSWQKTYLSEVWWYENCKSGVTTNGLKTADVLTVRIPDTSIEVKKGDYIVKGKCDIEMKTVKDLSTVSYHCIEGANYNTFGMNPHIKVVAT